MLISIFIRCLQNFAKIQKLFLLILLSSMLKTFVASWAWAWFSSFPIKLICCGSFNLVCVLKSIAVSLKCSLKYAKTNKLPVLWSLFLLMLIVFSWASSSFFTGKSKKCFHQLKHWNLLFQRLVHSNVKKNLYDLLQHFLQTTKQTIC